MNLRKQLSTLIVLFPAVMSLGPHAEASAEVAGAAITLGDVRAEKYARTAAEKKIDSRLLRELHHRGYGNTAWHLELPRANEIATKISEQGRLLVQIAGEITPRLRAEIAAVKGIIKSGRPAQRQLIVELPLRAIIPIAELTEVESIEVPVEPIHNANVSNEGVIAHAVDIAFETYGLTGAGVKIGVISDSVDYLVDLQAAGDLPEVVVLSDAQGSGEGTAMLQIVHDVAPRAELYFASADPPFSFLDAVDRMRDAGVDIVVDDITLINAAPFQFYQEPIAVQALVESGTFYFSAAGNVGNRQDSRVYEGDYVAGLAPFDLQGYEDLHLYVDPVEGNSFANTALANGRLCLYWADPVGASSNDYDLVLVNDNLDIVGVSNTIQDGSPGSEPRECLEVTRGQGILVLRNPGAEARPIYLSVNLADRLPGMRFTTDGGIRGHQAVPDVFAVAASTVPVTGTFNADSRVANYSGSGNRRLFFEPDGTPITPDNFTFTGGVVIQKPDITAASGVTTSTPNRPVFEGTSAAAPYAAAISALLLEARPDLTVPELRQIFAETAIDIESPGRDQYSGYGIVMATGVLQYVLNARAVDAMGAGFVALLAGGLITLVLRRIKPVAISRIGF